MSKAIRIIAIAVAVPGACLGAGREAASVSARYQALRCPAPPDQGTWAILDRDGANRQVEPYLSSLGSGEFGTGAIVSPAFTVAGDIVRFTLCGHDGQGGGQEKNFIALVDAASGQVLQKTFAPGSDPLQPRSWDVAPWKGRRVRIEVHDGIAANGFAWLGVGSIDAAPALSVDFRKGLPDGWNAAATPRDERTELVEGGIPFLRPSAVYTLVPRSSTAEIACGFAAERLFFLGGTVARGRPLTVYGTVEIVYRGGDAERFPLRCGFTLDVENKLPSPSKALHLHASGDPFQFYFVLAPRSEVIESIRLSSNPNEEHLPRITAVTCRTRAESERLLPLPDVRRSAEEAAWIESHAISRGRPDMRQIEAEIRRAHRMPQGAASQ